MLMPKYTEDENGYITFPDTPLSRPGVFQYLGREISLELEPDKVYNVYRPESELNNPETIESFKLSPWFGVHEMAGEGYRGADEIGVQGTTGQDVAYKPGIGLVGTVKAFGNKLHDAIRSGMRELSLGFRCTWEIVSGKTPDGLQYDVIQRNIRGNHLASVDEGRAGPMFSVAMDGARIALDNLSNEGQKMTLEELMKAVAESELTPDEMAALKVKLDEMEGGKRADEEEGGEDMAKDEDKPDDEAKDEDKASKDECSYDKAKDEDKSEKAMDKEGGSAMDAMMKEIRALNKKVEALSGNAMDAASIERQINEKNSLLKDLEPYAGKIDGTGLDSHGVAKKAASVLGIACDSKSALDRVRGYIHARKTSATTVDNGNAMDGAYNAELSKTFDEAGL